MRVTLVRLISTATVKKITGNITPSASMLAVSLCMLE